MAGLKIANQNKNMEALIEKVKQWGVDKGITGTNGSGTLLGQLSKSQEELTETRDAAIRIELLPRSFANTQALQDGIGDTTVTLILAAEIAGLNFEECLQVAYDEIKDRTGRMENGTFIKN